MKRPPAWVPYALGAGAVALIGYFLYRKLSVKLPAVGQAISSEFIDIFKPKGVSNVAQNAPLALPGASGKAPVMVGVTPAYQSAVNGFIAANPQMAPGDVVKRLIAAAWKVGDPAPVGLNPY